LIEDDPDIRMLATMTLRMNDIPVVACAEGESALRAMEASEFSLVILDVTLPDMSGSDVLRQMIERFDDRVPPVALFTAHSPEVTAREFRGHPVTEILAKPFEPSALAQAVQALLRRSRVPS